MQEDSRTEAIILTLSIIVAVLIISIFIVMLVNSGKKPSHTELATQAEETTIEEVTTPTEETTIEAEQEKAPEKLDVTISAKGKFVGSGLVFDIETNLPDGASLILSLENGVRKSTYDLPNNPENYVAQAKVTVKDGKAESEGFSDKGKKLTRNCDLSITMSMPSTQSNAVQSVVGKFGENMIGELVVSSEEPFTNEKTNLIEANFSVVIDGDEVNISPSKGRVYSVVEDNSDADPDEIFGDIATSTNSSSSPSSNSSNPTYNSYSSSSSSSPSSAYSDNSLDSFTALDMADRFAKEQCAYPESVKFTWGTKAEDAVTRVGDKFVVRHHITAQNAFGVPIRVNYVCTLHRQSGSDKTWVCDSIILDE